MSALTDTSHIQTVTPDVAARPADSVSPESGPLRVRVFGANASDDALFVSLQEEVFGVHAGTMPGDTLAAIQAAKRCLHENPDFESIAVASGIACPTIGDALEQSEDWCTGDEVLMVYRFGGLYLRLCHKHNRQAEIEFEVCKADGASLL